MYTYWTFLTCVITTIIRVARIFKISILIAVSWTQLLMYITYSEELELMFAFCVMNTKTFFKIK